MTKVITYGTYDLLHYGHIRLLERAKALGDYLIVGVTSDAFDRGRGKINVQQSLMERIDAVRATGIADQIVVEEYEGQKIDDIQKYGVDIFTVGSDWVGKFDYLNNYCRVVYLDRTQGVSSSELRSEKRMERIGIVGSSHNAMAMMAKFERESHYANGVAISGICTRCGSLPPNLASLPCVTDDFQKLLDASDAIYLISRPEKHYGHIKEALSRGKHVLVESPVATDCGQYEELISMAKERGLVLMDGIKTAYSTAYNRMMVLAKSGTIGDIVSVDATCTSLPKGGTLRPDDDWNSITAWGPTALLPILHLLGTDYDDMTISSKMLDGASHFDIYSKIDFRYPGATASLRVAQGVKSEGQLVVSGTRGYIYVPAPWWKTDYFELRYEDQSDNRRYFYQLEGEGIRNEIVAFLRAIDGETSSATISLAVSEGIVRVMADFYTSKGHIIC